MRLAALRATIERIGKNLARDDFLVLAADLALLTFGASAAWVSLPYEGQMRTVVARGVGAADLVGRAGPLTHYQQLTKGQRRLAIIAPAAVDPTDPLLGPLAASGERSILLPLAALGEGRAWLGMTLAAGPSPPAAQLRVFTEQVSLALTRGQQRHDQRHPTSPPVAALDYLPAPVLIYDAAGALAAMNATAMRMLSYRGVRPGDTVMAIAAKIEARSCHGQPIAGEHLAATRALGGEVVSGVKMDIAGPNSNRRFIVACAAPLSAGGAVELWQDITAVYETASANVDLLAAVGHELRNPLAAILSNAEILQLELARGGHLRQPEQRLATIVEQTKQVVTLLRDVVDVWRTSVGRLTLDIQPTRLDEPVRRAIAQFATQTGRPPVELHAPSDLPLVAADAARIEQVMRHVLHSAAYRAPRGATLTVTLGTEDRHAVVVVSRSGGGSQPPIPRPRPSRSAQGLAHDIDVSFQIALAIVTAHGGELVVDDDRQHGSSYRLRLRTV